MSSHPPLGEQTREPVMLPTAAHRSPSKALCEFPVWPLVTFYWLGKAKKHTDNCEFKLLHLVSTYHPKVHSSHLLFHVWGSLLIERSLAAPIAFDIFTYLIRIPAPVSQATPYMTTTLILLRLQAHLTALGLNCSERGEEVQNVLSSD